MGIRRQKLPAVALAFVGFPLLLAACAVTAATLPAFGYVWLTFIVLATVDALLVLRLRPMSASSEPTADQPRWLRRVLGIEGWLLIGALSCWLGLIAWSALCHGGPEPPTKADPGLIRVVTWNIHCGQDGGPPWKEFDWPARKHALKSALDSATPDILCVQEATPEQVAFLEEALPGHSRVGIGRDGEAAGGEHCAIYFNRQRFGQIDGGTFWLEEPTDQPRAGSALDVKRICTWVRLADVGSPGRHTFRIYNTHLYLTETRRRTAAQVILAHLAAGHAEEPVLLTADFNASPSAPSRRLFLESALADSAEQAGKPTGMPTFHGFFGIGLWSIDAILVDRHWRVHNHLILDVKPRNTFPSDHYAVLADLSLSD